jgi:RNA polymerase sigma factor (sigma-70 family)
MPGHDFRGSMSMSDGRTPSSGYPGLREVRRGTDGGTATAGDGLVASVFVVDDEEGVRESLRVLAESVRLPVETFGTAQAFLDAVDETRPGCVVVDVRLPGMSGLELQHVLAMRSVSPPIIMITGYGDVPTAVRALKAGAFDFIEKPFSRQLLLDRIAEALEVDRAARRRAAERSAVAAKIAKLTPREREVMNLVVTGMTNKAIASELGLREKTVEVHRAQVMRKVRVLSVAELVRATALVHGE